MKMIWCGLRIKENCHVLVSQLHGNIHFKTLGCREIKAVFRDVKWCFNVKTTDAFVQHWWKWWFNVHTISMLAQWIISEALTTVSYFYRCYCVLTAISWSHEGREQYLLSIRVPQGSPPRRSMWTIGRVRSCMLLSPQVLPHDDHSPHSPSLQLTAVK